jgi:hypothetical protein
MMAARERDGSSSPPIEGGNMRRNLVLWIILLLVGLLLGFVPQYLHSRELQSKLSSASQQVASCQLKQQLSDVRDAASLAYLEATRKNYGTAGEHASRMFNQLQQLSAATSDSNLKSVLAQVASKRDAVTSALASGDAAATGDLQSIVLELEQDAKI